MTRGHWCDFCQTFHSSASCYHPGGQMLRMAQARIDSLECALDAMTEKRNRLVERAGDWQLRAEQAEAALACMTEKAAAATDRAIEAKADFAAERERAEMWEWALDYLLGEARAVDLYYDLPEARIGDTADAKRCLRKRYAARPAPEDE